MNDFERLFELDVSEWQAYQNWNGDLERLQTAMRMLERQKFQLRNCGVRIPTPSCPTPNWLNWQSCSPSPSAIRARFGGRTPAVELRQKIVWTADSGAKLFLSKLGFPHEQCRLVSFLRGTSFCSYQTFAQFAETWGAIRCWAYQIIFSDHIVQYFNKLAFDESDVGPDLVP